MLAWDWGVRLRPVFGIGRIQKILGLRGDLTSLCPQWASCQDSGEASICWESSFLSFLSPKSKDTPLPAVEVFVSMQTLMTLATMAISAPLAFAEEALQSGVVEEAASNVQEAATQSRAAGPGDYLILGLPIIVYGAFSLYRAKVNPRIKISDFLFILAAAVIVGNILSIVIFKKRIFWLWFLLEEHIMRNDWENEMRLDQLWTGQTFVTSFADKSLLRTAVDYVIALQIYDRLQLRESRYSGGCNAITFKTFLLIGIWLQIRCTWLPHFARADILLLSLTVLYCNFMAAKANNGSLSSKLEARQMALGMCRPVLQRTSQVCSYSDSWNYSKGCLLKPKLDHSTIFWWIITSCGIT